LVHIISKLPREEEQAKQSAKQRIRKRDRDRQIERQKAYQIIPNAGVDL